jgi:putative membrane protein
MNMIKSEQFWNKAIVWVSVIVPVLVTILAYVAPPKIDTNFDLHLLPKLHAVINGSVALLLLASFYFIKQKNIQAHKICNLSALVLSALFLVSYVTYHSLTEPTRYCGEGAMRGIYFFILVTHIVLAAAILPLILFTFLRAFTGNFERHRRLARWTFPLWLYVSVTGVIVYLMISPCY